MTIDTNSVVSMTDANQNFSKVTRIVDEFGQAIIFKNNSPKYIVMEFKTAEKKAAASNAEVMSAANSLMEQYDDTFKELAK